jgi:hypothetical protein
MKRDGGKFLWKQVFHAKRLKGVRSFYGAMWDEYVALLFASEDDVLKF